MKISFPYSIFSKKFEKYDLSSYVRYRHALKGHLDKNGQVTVAEETPSGESVLNWLYGLLSVLDAKASALMRLNGVMLAATAFMLNPNYETREFIRILVAGSGIISAISIALCLLVVSVDWPFLGLAEKSNGKIDFSKEFFHLQNIANFRQSIYRFAWKLSLLASVVFLIALSAFFVYLLI